MRRHKFSIVLLLLLTMSFTLLAPVSAANAASLSGQPSHDGGSAGSSILNILLGLLFGKLFGGSSGGSDIGKVLGLSTTPVAPAGPSVGGGRGTLITTAQKYMGVPYVWGGETPDGFDCSGFTQYVMKENSITIPRTAADQFAAGTPVDKANLQVGDMVFFTTYKPGASHVGFYMGDGKFIHASSAAKAVTVSRLDEAYYTQHYIGARRY